MDAEKHNLFNGSKNYYHLLAAADDNLSGIWWWREKKAHIYIDFRQAEYLRGGTTSQPKTKSMHVFWTLVSKPAETKKNCLLFYFENK